MLVSKPIILLQHKPQFRFYPLLCPILTTHLSPCFSCSVAFYRSVLGLPNVYPYNENRRFVRYWNAKNIFAHPWPKENELPRKSSMIGPRILLLSLANILVAVETWQGSWVWPTKNISVTTFWHVKVTIPKLATTASTLHPQMGGSTQWPMAKRGRIFSMLLPYHQLEWFDALADTWARNEWYQLLLESKIGASHPFPYVTHALLLYITHWPTHDPENEWCTRPSSSVTTPTQYINNNHGQIKHTIYFSIASVLYFSVYIMLWRWHNCYFFQLMPNGNRKLWTCHNSKSSYSTALGFALILPSHKGRFEFRRRIVQMLLGWMKNGFTDELFLPRDFIGD